jgi:radical SAM superfamily enzyme YgiQ (UPF0313 family)
MQWQKNKRTDRQALLVFPREPGTIVSNDPVFPFPMLGLTQIAASFPETYHVRIIDEAVSPLRGTEDADLVLITSLTATVSRAYKLADTFLKRGIPVVLGGVHATVLPDEASQHATSVVIGEADTVIPQLLADFEKGQLARRYQCEKTPDLDTIPKPAVELLTWRHRLFLSAIQTSRGCPNNCDFCSVPATFGRRLRLKSLETIEDELVAYSRFGFRYLFVVDDNFTANKDRALAILDMFRHYQFKWMGFSTLSIAEDDEFLQKLRQSGCVSLFIGFESLHKQAIYRKNNQYNDSHAVSAAIKKIHAAHIGIQGSFIFGFDQDTPEVFQEVVDFIQQNHIEVPNVNILTPFPGTELYANMEKEGRILHRKWPLYDMNHVVFEPQGMTAEQLQQGFVWALKYLAAPTSIFKRLSIKNSHYGYFLMANFALHRSHTKLAKQLWNRAAQHAFEKEGLCPC